MIDSKCWVGRIAGIVGWSSNICCLWITCQGYHYFYHQLWVRFSIRQILAFDVEPFCFRHCHARLSECTSFWRISDHKSMYFPQYNVPCSPKLMHSSMWLKKISRMHGIGLHHHYRSCLVSSTTPNQNSESCARSDGGKGKAFQADPPEVVAFHSKGLNEVSARAIIMHHTILL